MSRNRVIACLLCLSLVMTMAGTASARELLATSPFTNNNCQPSGVFCTYPDPCLRDLTTYGCPFTTTPEGDTCYVSHCKALKYRGYTVGPCGVLVLNDKTGAVVCGSGTQN